MGYNTSLLIMNDALSDIENDTEFGRRVSRAVSSVDTAKWQAREAGQPFYGVDVAAHGVRSISVNAATVMETHHADATSVVAFGGNRGIILSNALYAYGTEDEEVRILRELADQLGYHIRKKPSK